MLSVVSCLGLFHISYYKQLTFTRLIFRTCKSLMQATVTSSMYWMQRNVFLVYQGCDGVACQMSWASHLTCMVDFKDEDTAYVFYVIKPIRHFLTSAAHRVAPCLCWISLFVLISITVDWLLASVHHRERRVSYRCRPGREAFPRQCRSSTDFLWCLKDADDHRSALGPEEISEGEGNGQSVVY